MVKKQKINLDRVTLLSNIMSKFEYGIGLEVGTFKAEFAKEFLKKWNGTLFMVDVWSPIESNYDDLSNHGNYEYNIYDEAIKNISEFGDRAVMIRCSSLDASKIFLDESLDFVYIDANHSYDSVIEDINLWFPKIKDGGYLCGHDYINMDWYSDPNFAENKKDKFIWAGDTFHGVFGVNPAVDEFCQKNNFELILTNEWFGSWIIQKKEQTEYEE